MRTSGRFWLAEDPEHEVEGWLDTSQRWPEVELSQVLTASVTTRPGADGSTDVVVMEPADDQAPPVSVHGVLRGRGRVTLVGATTSGRQGFLGERVGRAGLQQMRGDYAVLGAHVPGAGTRFREVEVELRHLDDWAQLRSITAVEHKDGSRIEIVAETVAPEAVEVADPPGRLVLDAHDVVTWPTVRGALLRRTAVLRWEGSGQGLSVPEVWARVVDPVRVLLSLAVDADSPAVTLRVREEAGGAWLGVVHPGLDQAAAGQKRPDLRYEVLLTREELDLAALGRWLGGVGSLTPLPRLVAGAAIDSSGRTVENRLLELATAAEGLHARLHPKQQRMTRSQAEAARKTATRAIPPDLPEDVRVAVHEALGRLDAPTFAQRLRTLAERVEPAAPGITGDTEKWVQQVKEARNSFAHQSTNGPRGGTDVLGYHVLAVSLRWFLTVALLLQAGVDPADLAERLRQHRSYNEFTRMARDRLPAVYATTP